MSYGGNGGSPTHPPAAISGDGVFGPSGPTTPSYPVVRLGDITDGTTNTLLLGERNHVDPNYDTYVSPTWALDPMGRWAPSGGMYGLSDVTLSTLGPIGNYGSQHVGIAQVALADGSVRALNENISMTVFRAVGTRSGREAVGDF